MSLEIFTLCTKNDHGQVLNAFWPDDLDVNMLQFPPQGVPGTTESDIVRDKMRGKQTRTRLVTRPPAYYTYIRIHKDFRQQVGNLFASPKCVENKRML